MITQKQKEELIAKLAAAATDGFASRIKRILESGEFKEVDPLEVAKQIKDDTEQSIRKVVYAMTEEEAREMLLDILLGTSMREMVSTVTNKMKEWNETPNPFDGFAC